MSEVAKVITVADRSAKAVVTATTALAKVAQELSLASQSLVTLSDEIQIKEGDLGALTAQFDTTFRTKQAELALRVLEDEDSVLGGLLQKRKLAHIAIADLSELRRALEEAQVTAAETITSAVTQAEKALHAKYTSEIATVKADHRVLSAEQEANSKAKDMRIEFLTAQVAQLQKTIDDERNTRLEVAKAESQRQGVVVNTGKA